MSDPSILRWETSFSADALVKGKLHALIASAKPLREFHSARSAEILLTSPATTRTIAAWLGDELVAHAALAKRDGSDETRQLSLELTVGPTWQVKEVAVRLVEWIKATAPDMGAECGSTELSIFASARDHEIWNRTVLVQANFRVARVFVNMHLRLASLPTNAFTKTSYDLRTFSADISEELRLACNDAFADNWGTTAWSPTSWEENVVECDDFLPELSYLLITPDRTVTGFVLTSRSDAVDLTAERKRIDIDLVGVRKASRGRGLAFGLLSQALLAAVRKGYDEAALTVDFEEEHGALRLYRRLGFETTSRSTTYTLILRL